MNDHLSPRSDRRDAGVSRRRALGLGGLGAAAAMGLTGLATSSASAAGTPDRKVLFRDDFNGAAGTAPDSKKWEVVAGTPESASHTQELETLSRDPQNVSLNGSGALAITARHDGGQWTSGLVRTANTFSFRHGIIEARVKMPLAKGTAPRLSLMPKNAGAFPDGGAIDVFQRTRSDFDYTSIRGNLQLPGWADDDAIMGPAFVGTPEAWHRFRLRKEPNLLTWYVDGQEFWRVPKDDAPSWPFEDHDYYLQFELPVGGNDGDSNVVDKSEWPQTMLIDNVYVSEL